MKTGKTKYRLSKDSGIPYSTLSDICSGKTPLSKCSAETIYRLSAATKLSCDEIIGFACCTSDECKPSTYATDLLSTATEDSTGCKSAMCIPEELRHCFWDTKIEELDLERNKDFIISRLYTKGGMSGIAYVNQIYSPEEIIHTAKVSRNLNPIVANYLSEKYGISRDEMVYFAYHKAEMAIWGH